MANIKLVSLIALLGILIICYGFFNVFTSSYEKPDMQGHITNISDMQSSHNNMVIGSILVEGSMNNQSTKISVKINKETSLFKQEGNKHHSITFNELKTGQNVGIKFTGPILTSFPPQATADRIVVLEK